jgi:DNA-binding LytR/AlgR family response regulator
MDLALSALVIDDEVPVRRALCDILRAQLGAKSVVEIDSGPSAMRVLQELRPGVLFVDLSAARRIDLRSYRAVPPALVILSACDQESVRTLHASGLNAWMKPEVFAHLPRILRWATAVRCQPDRLCAEWALTLSALSPADPRNCSFAVTFDGEQQNLIDCQELLAATDAGRKTTLVLVDKIVRSPHGLDFLEGELCGRGFTRVGRHWLIRYAQPLRWVSPFVRWILPRAPDGGLHKKKAV